MRITYEIITPESAEQGDVAEQGFVEPDYNIHVPVAERGDFEPGALKWTLRGAELFLGRYGCEDCGRWFQQVDGSTDYSTGAVTRYALHPDDSVTVASYDRLKRIFCL